MGGEGINWCTEAVGTRAQRGKRLTLCERESVIYSETLLRTWLGRYSESGGEIVLAVH